MLKFFYRLKRGRGVVLFVVIAVMTLLIAMATTAYFTASSSYKTVVSNYDSSQLYISTTSLADMVIGALTQSSSRPDVMGATESSASDVKLNNYDTLKSEVAKMKAAALTALGPKLTSLLNTYSPTNQNVNDLFTDNDPSDSQRKTNLKNKQNDVNKAFTEACEATTPLVGYSHNIYASASGTNSDILNAAAAKPVETGIIDGVKITIKLKNMDFEKEAGSATGRFIYYFDVDTTGFYRNSYVTVQDTIYNISGTNNVVEVPDFDCFFKSTGGPEKDGKGDRAVVLGSEIISDNAYFENTYTIFGELSGGSNNFYGGITATGSVYFTRQLNCKIPAPGKMMRKSDNGKDWVEFSDSTTTDARHDWIIKGNLGLLCSNTHVDLNGNDLYVDGDLIIGTQTGDLKANRVFVNGNIYMLSDTSQITANEIYCGGKVIAGDKDTATMALSHYVEVDTNPDPDIEVLEIMPYSEYAPGNPPVPNPNYTIKSYSWNTIPDTIRAGWNTVGDEIAFVQDKLDEAAAEAMTAKANIAPNTKSGTFTNPQHNGVTIHTSKLGSITNVTGVTEKADYNQYSKTTKISTQKAVGDHYEYTKSGDMTISQMFDDESGATKTKDWPSYTAFDETVKNVLKLDFENAPQIAWDKTGLWTWDQTDPNDYKTASTTWTYDVRKADGSTETITADANITLAQAGQYGKYKIEYNFYSTNGDKATAIVDTTDSATAYLTVDLPYVEKGYELDIQYKNYVEWGNAITYPSDNNKATIFNIHTGNNVKTDPSTGEKTYDAMPIVLQANYKDSSATKEDADGNNAFAWRGKECKGNAAHTVVQLLNEDGSDTATGTVIFEMGNIDNNGNYNTLANMADVVTYHASEWEFVGTKAQADKVDALTQNFSDQEKMMKMLQTSTASDPKKGNDVDPTYDNRVMFVSNKVTKPIPKKADGTIDTTQVRSGFVTTSPRNTICGYLYGPATTYVNPDSSSDSVPVFGGLIVAEYVAGKNHYLYAEPDLNLVRSLFSAMNGSNSKDKTPAEGYWYLSGVGMGTNYLG